MNRKANLQTTLASIQKASVSLTSAYELLKVLASKVDVSRMNRSQGVVISGLTFVSTKDNPVNGLNGFAASSTGSGGYKCRVNFSPRSFSCQCPDSQQRGATNGPCKHVAALSQYGLATIKARGSEFNAKLENALEDLFSQLP